MTKAKAAVRHLYHRGDLHRAIMSSALKVLRVTESTEFSLWELGLTLLLVDRHVGPTGKIDELSGSVLQGMLDRLATRIPVLPAGAWVGPAI